MRRAAAVAAYFFFPFNGQAGSGMGDRIVLFNPITSSILPLKGRKPRAPKPFR